MKRHFGLWLGVGVLMNLVSVVALAGPATTERADPLFPTNAKIKTTVRYDHPYKLPTPDSHQAKPVKKSKESSHESKESSWRRYWKGTNAQLGLVLNTGNTNDQNFNAGFNLQYANQPWSNLLQFNIQISGSDGRLTKEKYLLQDQANYSFSRRRKNFIFSNLKFLEDKFSPYNYQTVLAAGYGRDLVKTQRFTMSAQAGPGVRRDKVRETQEINTNTILTTALNVNWQITHNAFFTEQLSYDYGQPFNFLRSVTAVTNKITGNIAVQVSYTVEYYSQIPLGSTNRINLDTTTNIALVYNFA